MPKLWSESIQAHRQLVRDAVLDATGDIVRREGLLALTMSRIAEASGIGRPTLYNYFPDVEAVLAAWHDRHIGQHLDRLGELASSFDDAGRRLEAVLETYALIAHQRETGNSSDVAAALHSDERVRRARRRVHDIVRQLIVEGSRSGQVRGDIDPDELAAFALHALSAASELRSRAAVRRLVRLTLASLRPAGLSESVVGVRP